MDRIQTLQVFSHVVETGSFSKAADQLNLHVSAVSKAVKYLENQLGSRLLNRTARSLKLTAEGEVFYEKVQFLLTELEETFQDLSSVSQQEKGKLRIELPTAIAPFVIAKLPSFKQQYPDIQLILTVSDNVSNLVDEGLGLHASLRRIGRRQLHRPSFNQVILLFMAYLKCCLT